tara:strand:- start:88 stop:429 length:342 start_codon:yes stop_codon:yes gene_type:complete
MKYHGLEIKSFAYLARVMILNQLVDLEERIHEAEFNDLDVRSPVAQEVLKKEGIEISHLEAVEFLTTLKFEIAKVMGKLENSTGVDTGRVFRNNQGYIQKAAYAREVDQEGRA